MTPGLSVAQAVSLALGTLDAGVRSVTTLSPVRAGRKAGRATFRAELGDGTTVKARLFESDEEAARVAGMIGRVGAPLADVVTRVGPVLVERWIDGETVSLAIAAARAEELGALLARLHAAAVPGIGEPAFTAARHELARAHLARLAEADRLERAEADALLAELARLDPGQAPAVLVHLDYCPENLVVDETGRFHVIDNEWLNVDGAGADLGRTFARWPMDDAVWTRFLEGYGARAPARAQLRFWGIVMAARSAVLRLSTSTEIGLPLARLRELCP